MHSTKYANLRGLATFDTGYCTAKSFSPLTAVEEEIKVRTPGIIGRYNCFLTNSSTGLACPWDYSRLALATALSWCLTTFGIAYKNERCAKFGHAYFRTATSMFDNCIPNSVASSQLANCVSKQLFHLCSCNPAVLAPFRSSSIMHVRITWRQPRF